MNRYIKPELEVIKFEATDIIMTSGDSEDSGTPNSLDIIGHTVDTLDSTAYASMFDR